MFRIWIEDYINTPPFQSWIYLFHEKHSFNATWFEERRKQMIPNNYEERRNATMLEF